MFVGVGRTLDSRVRTRSASQWMHQAVFVFVDVVAQKHGCERLKTEMHTEHPEISLVVVVFNLLGDWCR